MSCGLVALGSPPSHTDLRADIVKQIGGLFASITASRGEVPRGTQERRVGRCSWCSGGVPIVSWGNKSLKPPARSFVPLTFNEHCTLECRAQPDLTINPGQQQISGFETHKYGVRSCSKKIRLTFYKTHVVDHGTQIRLAAIGYFEFYNRGKSVCFCSKIKKAVRNKRESCQNVLGLRCNVPKSPLAKW